MRLLFSTGKDCIVIIINPRALYTLIKVLKHLSHFLKASLSANQSGR